MSDDKKTKNTGDKDINTDNHDELFSDIEETPKSNAVNAVDENDPFADEFDNLGKEEPQETNDDEDSFDNLDLDIDFGAELGIDLPKTTVSDAASNKKIKVLQKKLAEKDEKIAELEKQNSDLTDKNSQLEEALKSAQRASTRLQEDFNNKSAKKVEKFIVENFIPAVDDLENALSYIEGEKDIEGIQGVLSNLYNSLAKMGVEKIDAADQKFDPETHNAIAVQNIADKGDNVILHVQREGYKNTNTGALLRAPDVIVNKKQ